MFFDNLDKEISAWTITFKQKELEDKFSELEFSKRSRRNIAFAIFVASNGLFQIFYQIIFQEYSQKPAKYYYFYFGQVIFSLTYIGVNQLFYKWYAIYHWIYLFFFSLNACWSIYDSDFLKFDPKKTFTYGFTLAVLLCGNIDGGKFITKAVLNAIIFFLLILSDQIPSNAVTIQSMFRATLPVIILIMKLRHEEQTKREIFIKNVKLEDLVSIVHKQIPTPFIVAKFNKKESKMNFQASNLQAEKQLGIYNQVTYEKFMENCYLIKQPYQMKQSVNTNISSFAHLENNHQISSQDQNKGQNYSPILPPQSMGTFYHEKIKYDYTNSLKYFIRNKVEYLLKNNYVQKILKVEKNTNNNFTFDLPKTETNPHLDNQANGVPFMQKTLAVPQKIIDNKQFSIQGLAFDSLINQIDMLNQANNKNINNFSFQQFVGNKEKRAFEDYILEESNSVQQDPSSQCLTLQYVRPREIKLLNYDKHSYSDTQIFDDLTSDLNIAEMQENQNKQPIKFSDQLYQFLPNNKSQQNIIERTRTKTKQKSCKQENQSKKAQSNNKIIVSNVIEQQESHCKAQKDIASKQNSKPSLEYNQKVNKSTQKNHYNLKTFQYLEKQMKNKPIFNKENDDQTYEEKISIEHNLRNNSSIIPTRYSVRFRLFKTNEILVILVIESESYKTQYKQEKCKNKLLSRIRSHQQSLIKKSLNQLNNILNNISQVSLISSPIDLNSTQLALTELLACLISMNYLYHSFNLFNQFVAQSERISISHINAEEISEFDLAETIHQIVSSLACEAQMTEKIFFKANQSHTIKSNQFLIKILSFSFLRYLIQNNQQLSRHQSQISIILEDKSQEINSYTQSITIKSNMKQEERIQITIKVPFNESLLAILESSTLFTFSFESLLQDELSCQFLRQTAWLLKTSAQIIRQLGPYAKLNIQKDIKNQQIIISFLLFKDLNILLKPKENLTSRAVSSERAFIDRFNSGVDNHNIVPFIKNYNIETPLPQTCARR